MSDYIDRVALGIDLCRRNVFERQRYVDGWNDAVKILMNAPTADVQEVRHGEWTKQYPENALDGVYFCSACFHEQDIANGMITPLDMGFHYCPNCGAKMDGGKR